MIAPNIIGRQLIFEAAHKNQDQCRAAIQAFRTEAEKAMASFKAMQDKKNGIGFDIKTSEFSAQYFKPDAYENEILKSSIATSVMANLRMAFAEKLSQNILGNHHSDQEEVDAFDFLERKHRKDRDNLSAIEGKGWNKLFQKILAQKPEELMKSQAAKEKSLAKKTYDKESPQLVLQWQTSEGKIDQLFSKHNQNISRLDFNLLAAEIGDQPSAVPLFKQFLREWALERLKQPGGNALQDLLQVTDFGKKFSIWQQELTQELKTQYPNVLLKPQVRLLARELSLLGMEMLTARTEQQRIETRLDKLIEKCVPKPAHPQGTFNIDVKDMLTAHTFPQAARAYDFEALKYQGPQDIANMKTPAAQPPVPKAPPSPPVKAVPAPTPVTPAAAPQQTPAKVAAAPLSPAAVQPGPAPAPLQAPAAVVAILQNPAAVPPAAVKVAAAAPQQAPAILAAPVLQTPAAVQPAVVQIAAAVPPQAPVKAVAAVQMQAAQAPAPIKPSKQPEQAAPKPAMPSPTKPAGIFQRAIAWIKSFFNALFSWFKR